MRLHDRGEDRSYGGLDINEIKTTGAFDAEKYMNSSQWRLMLLLFNAASVTYRVACFRDSEPLELRGIESLTVYPYPALQDDCFELIRNFVHYVLVRGLDAHLREKQVEALARAKLRD